MTSQILPEITKKRVAAYARVSTHDEDQPDSLSAQRSYYETLINGKREWIYAGVYYDEGITGTSYAHQVTVRQGQMAHQHGEIDPYQREVPWGCAPPEAVHYGLPAEEEKDQ